MGTKDTESGKEQGELFVVPSTEELEGPKSRHPSSDPQHAFSHDNSDLDEGIERAMQDKDNDDASYPEDPPIIPRSSRFPRRELGASAVRFLRQTLEEGGSPTDRLIAQRKAEQDRHLKELQERATSSAPPSPKPKP